MLAVDVTGLSGVVLVTNFGLLYLKLLADAFESLQPQPGTPTILASRNLITMQDANQNSVGSILPVTLAA